MVACLGMGAPHAPRPGGAARALLRPASALSAMIRGMSRPDRMLEDFSHVPEFTGYMARVVDQVNRLTPARRRRIVDLPAGSGVLVDALRAQGHDVLGADINDARPDFVHADMDAPLPFDDGAFDVAICLEGVEHVLDPNLLLRELVRIVPVGGHVILSTPNVMNLYSRWYALFRGYPYQFRPSLSRPVAPGERRDRGHVNPMSYLRLRYLLEHFGAEVIALDGDRAKRKALLPLLLPFPLLGRLLTGADFRRPDEPPSRLASIRRDCFSRPVLFSRSLVVVAQRRA